MESEKRAVRAKAHAGDTRKAYAHIALIVLLLCCIGYYVWSHLPVREVSTIPADAPVIGVIDMHKVMDAHRVSAEVERLEREKETLSLEVERLLSMRRADTAPPLDEVPFQMAEEQKERQQLRITQAEQKKAQGEAMERWVKEREPRFNEKRKDIEALYRNRIVNIELKLDNAQAMGLTEEMQTALYQELESLRHERSAKIRDVFDEYLAERNAYMQSLVLKDASIALRDRAVVHARAMERKDAAQMRNTEHMQSEMQDVEIAARIREKQGALAAKMDEIKILKEHIRRDVESRVEKLAIMYHLDMVYAGNVLPYAAGLVHGAVSTDVRPTMLPQGRQVMDLTDALIKELSE